MLREGQSARQHDPGGGTGIPGSPATIHLVEDRHSNTMREINATGFLAEFSPLIAPPCAPGRKPAYCNPDLRSHTYADYRRSASAVRAPSKSGLSSTDCLSSALAFATSLRPT